MGNIFLDFHINKETKRSIGQKYGLSQRQITTILEKTKNDFNKKLYFKIFGGVALFSAGIAGVYKIRNFFRKS